MDHLVLVTLSVVVVSELAESAQVMTASMVQRGLNHHQHICPYYNQLDG